MKLRFAFTIINLMPAPVLSILQQRHLRGTSQNKETGRETESINCRGNNDLHHSQMKVSRKLFRYTFTSEDIKIGMSSLDSIDDSDPPTTTQTPSFAPTGSPQVTTSDSDPPTTTPTPSFAPTGSPQVTTSDFSPLVALIEASPDYTGPLEPFGTATVRSNSENSFLFQLSVDGLDSNCTDSSPCAISVHDGTNCNDVGQSLWDGLEYYTHGQGSSRSTFTINIGENVMANDRHVVVVRDLSGLSMGCGILKNKTKSKVLQASMGYYPGYQPDESDPAPFGSVTVSFEDDETFEFAYDLEGLMSNCKECGIHIHAGKSCDDPDLVLGHWWNKYVVNDLWTTVGGSFYNSGDDGTAVGYFNLFSGFGYEENLGHAVVIHNQDGSRIGCGLLL